MSGKYKGIIRLSFQVKDIVIRDTVYHSGITEMNVSLASSIINKLNERVKDSNFAILLEIECLYLSTVQQMNQNLLLKSKKN
jgi:hypothetical protein